MTQNGDPLENALAERVNGILKEELLETTYPNFTQAQVAISIYNHQIRVWICSRPCKPTRKLEHSGKHWKNYYTIKKGKEVLVV
jgi:hypothetical protein